MGILLTIKPEKFLKSVEKLASYYDKDIRHYTVVSSLACQLFDGFAPLHRLSETDRYILKYAAMLHDIGAAYSDSAHNKKSYALILSSPFLEFDKKIRLYIGLIARYHRKALPHDSHDGYALLKKSERRYVCQLASLLRIADGLDVSHRAKVTQLSCTFTDSDAIVVVNSHDADAERMKALEKADLFETTYGRTLSVRNV